MEYIITRLSCSRIRCRHMNILLHIYTPAMFYPECFQIQPEEHLLLKIPHSNQLTEDAYGRYLAILLCQQA